MLYILHKMENENMDEPLLRMASIELTKYRSNMSQSRYENLSIQETPMDQAKEFSEFYDPELSWAERKIIASGE